jgi:hypothetical protein
MPDADPTQGYLDAIEKLKEAYGFGYRIGETLGLDEVGTRLGGSIYDFVNPNTIEAVRDKYRQEMPDVDFVTVSGSEVGLPDIDQVTIPLQ